MPKRQTQLPIQGRTPDSVELFVQPGKFGHHATTFPATEIWGAHKDDPATAAYRCALRFFYGKVEHPQWTFEQLASVGLIQTAENRYMAMKVPFKLGKSPKYQNATRKAAFYGQQSDRKPLRKAKKK